jgi:prolyl 4-hydroxylase
LSRSIVDQADRLRLENRFDEAFDLLDRERSDPQAVLLHGVWLLAGVGGPRDVFRGREKFREAGRMGSVKALIFEASLMANGGGSARDWAGALTLLKRCASISPESVEADLRLIAHMNVDAEGAPGIVPEPNVLREDPQILHFPGLISSDEASAIIAAASDIMRPALVIDPATGRQRAHPIRTSDGAVIGPTRESLVITAINNRLAVASATEPEQGEPLSVLRYNVGQQYRLHHDCLENPDNQRIKTALIYLTDKYEGGATEFPEIDVRVRGKAGDVVIFQNCDRLGRPYSSMRHAGLPVTAGTKWLATRWIRSSPFSVWPNP